MKFFILNSFVLNIIILKQISLAHDVNKENVQSRIVGGKFAKDKDYPWHATIAVQKKDKPVLCSGSLISRQWVLTSAQCVHGAETFSIGIGKINLDEYETNKLLVTTTSIIHEDFNNITLKNDIGLIKLPKLIVFSDRINATRLPSRNYSLQFLEDEKVNISGHGRNKFENGEIMVNLTSLQLETTSLQRCADYYGKEIMDFKSICATVAEKYGPCFNDTGAALMITQEDGYATQIGIFSYFHEEGCDLGYPSVYTRVGSYIQWISNKTGIPIIEDNNANSFQVPIFIIILPLTIYIKNSISIL